MPEEEQQPTAEQRQTPITPPKEISVEGAGMFEAALQFPSQFISPAVLGGLRWRMVWILNSLSGAPLQYQKWLGVMGDVYQIAEDAFCPPPYAVLEQDRVQIQTTAHSKQWAPGGSMDEAVVSFYWQTLDGLHRRLMALYEKEGAASLRAEIATIGSLPLICPDQECGYWFHGFAVRSILLDAMRERGVCNTLDMRFMTQSQANVLGYCVRANEHAIALPYFHASRKGLGDVEMQGADWEGEGALQFEPRVMHVWHASQIAGLAPKKINYSNPEALPGMLRAAQSCDAYPMDWDKKYAGEESEGALARWMVDGFLESAAQHIPMEQLAADYNAAVQSAAIDIVAARLAVQIRGIALQTPEMVEQRVQGTWERGYDIEPSNILDSALYLMRANTLARMAEMWLEMVAPQMADTWNLWRRRQFDECVAEPFDAEAASLDFIKERIKLGIYKVAKSKETSSQQKCISSGLLSLDELFDDLIKNASGAREGFLHHWTTSAAKQSGDQAAAGATVAGEICSSIDVSKLSKERSFYIYDKCESAINAFLVTLKDDEKDIAKKALVKWIKRDIEPKADQSAREVAKYQEWLESEMLGALEATGVPFGYDAKEGKWKVAEALDALERKYLLLPQPYDPLAWIGAVYKREVEESPAF